MKHATIWTISYFIVVAVIYVFFSFIEWELFAANWHWVSRTIFAIIAFLMIFGVHRAANLQNDSKDKG